MDIKQRGEMWTSYLDTPVAGFVCKLFSFSVTPPNKTATSEFNWCSFKIHHQNSSEKVTKEYYLNATTNNITLIDETGAIVNDLTVFIGKDISSDNNYNVYMLPTLNDSITYVQFTHCNILGFFKLNNNATFDVRASALSDKIYSVVNYNTNKLAPLNNWVDYSSLSKATIRGKNGIVEIDASLKSGLIADGTTILKIDDVKLRPSKPSTFTQCITWNGTTYKNEGNVRIESNGDIKLYGVATQPSRLDFHITYFV